jgi:hypothetical protein
MAETRVERRLAAILAADAISRPHLLPTMQPNQN